ncbi:hypothetical protein [Oleiagrimonas sp. MCCC 1A03011]|uniref:hypothetical protein n=1 Tax=Oleiagrimonas sp. MCCC 1A03011 TaxID=1926883 RepID=UPI0011BFA60F|nr:hypothetical protein [Oleiagrimonas sp. MCCC 1A03011]
MYEETRRFVLAIAEDLSKLAALAFKIGIMIGGACLLFYCYRINYFPTGISAGDAIILVFLASGFAIVYGMFISCLLSLGLWTTPILRPLIRLAARLRRRATKVTKLNQPIPELVSPNILHLVLGLLGVIIVYGFNAKQPGSWITMLGAAFSLAILASAYCDFSTKLQAARAKDKSPIITLSNTMPTVWRDTGKLRFGCVMSLVMICVVPLFMGGVSGLLLDSSMRFVGLRKNASVVLLEAPYSALLPKQYVLKSGSKAKGYTAFSGVIVAFQGIGTNTILEYATPDAAAYLSVPNQSVIVYPANKSIQPARYPRR